MELTNENKAAVLKKRIYDLMCSQYDSEIAIQEANVVTYPDLANLENLNQQLSDINAKIFFLKEQLSLLDSEDAL